MKKLLTILVFAIFAIIPIYQAEAVVNTYGPDFTINASYDSATKKVNFTIPQGTSWRGEDCGADSADPYFVGDAYVNVPYLVDTANSKAYVGGTNGTLAIRQTYAGYAGVGCAASERYQEGTFVNLGEVGTFDGSGSVDVSALSGAQTLSVKVCATSTKCTIKTYDFTIASAPVITTFTASPTSGTTTFNTTLTWSATNSPTSCTASGSWSGTKAASGSETVSIATAGAKAFNLTCTNAAGTSAPASVSVSASSPTVCTDNATVSITGPSSMDAGTSAPFTVNVNNTGTTKWYNSYYYLTYSTSPGAISITPGSGTSGLTYSPDLSAGSTKTFTLNVTAPSVAGTYSITGRNARQSYITLKNNDGSTCPSPDSGLTTYEYYGGSGSKTFTVNSLPLPNLTASQPSQTTATAGVSKSFTSTISNIGNASTGASFYNKFQVATAFGGGGSVSDQTETSMTALAAGASATASKSYTFPSAGQYSIRACADSRNQISESDEGNCSDWTNVTVAEPANNPPRANAGSNRSITLPINSVTISGASATDSDGTVVSKEWSKTSGPNTPTKTGDTTLTPTFSNLIEGSYTFRLSITDDDGATDSDDMIVTVNAAGLPSGTITGVGCSIPAGSSTCSDTNLTWSVSNPVAGASTAVTKTNPDGTVSTLASNTNFDTSINYGDTTFFLYHNGSELSSVTVSATCAGTSTWNSTSGKCEAPTSDPTGTITGTSCTIPAGASTCNDTNLTWSVSNPVAGASTAVTKTNPDGTVSTLASNTNFDTPINYGDTNFYLYHNGVMLAQTLASATCGGGSVWNDISLKCEMPLTQADLTASMASPYNATVNESQTFSARIVNNGGAAASGTITHIFQVDEDADHENGTTIKTTSTTDTINGGGAYAPVSYAHTFTTTGTKYVRFCADNNASFAGTITESNENNNCGAWADVTVSNVDPTEVDPSSKVNGGWGDWTGCSAVCGGGTMSRSCDDPEPANGGADCSLLDGGDPWRACNTQACGVGINKNGICADAHYYCAQGIAENKLNLTDKWTWTCSKSGTGVAANCEEVKKSPTFIED